jgi:hypothetical protein
LAVLALLAPTIKQASTHEPAKANHRSAMTDWASDVATDAVSGRGREPVEANRVALDVGGGAVVVQWSLSYVAYVSIRGGPGQRYPVARVRALAALERDGLEIARWTLGEDHAQGAKDTTVEARVTGTASGLFVDRTSGSRRTTYVLKVWNERASRDGMVTVGTRTMICEER